MIWGSISPTRRDKSPPRQVGSIWDGLPGVLSNGLHQHTAGQVLFRSSKAFPPQKKATQVGGFVFLGGSGQDIMFFCFFNFIWGGDVCVKQRVAVLFGICLRGRWSVQLSWMREDNGKHMFLSFSTIKKSAFALKFGLCGASVGWPKWLRSKSNKWNKKT